MGMLIDGIWSNEDQFQNKDGKFPIGIVHLHDCLRLGNG